MKLVNEKQNNTIDNIINIINTSPKMLVIGFVDKTDIVDNLISERIKSVLKSLNYFVKILEYDEGLIENNYSFFSVVTIPTYNVYYNSVLIEQFDLMDTNYEMKKKLSSLIIN